MTAKAANSRLSAPPSPVRVAARPPWRWHHCLSVPLWLWRHCRLWRCHWICSVLISYRSARLQQRSAGSHRLCLWHRGLARCSHRRCGSFRRSRHWYRSFARCWRNHCGSHLPRGFACFSCRLRHWHCGSAVCNMGTDAQWRLQGEYSQRTGDIAIFCEPEPIVSQLPEGQR